MTTQTAAMGRAVIVRADTGEDLLIALRAAVAREGMRNAAIVAGVGSLSRYRVHVVDTTARPVRDRYIERAAPLDIVAVAGYVLDGRVHAHITLSEGERAFGGHLEEGCQVLTFAVLTVVEMATRSLADWDRVGTLHGSP